MKLSMDNYFENVLMEAIFRCEKKVANNYFDSVYPFTTENILGYIPNFDLEDKSLLTVGSSCDQAINAFMFGCNNITVLDICPFTKFYFYLKISGIICLELREFLSFFCYKDFPKTFKNNQDAFNLEVFKKIKATLRLLDYESYLFFDELFSTYSNIDIRTNLFQYDEDKFEFLKQMNYYLSSDENFNRTKEVIHRLKPNFIITNIFNVELNNNFDNIWLSNIGRYIGLNKLKVLVDKLKPYLNQNGKILVCYLYDMTKDTEYKENWDEVYNLKALFDVFDEYGLEFINFKGIMDITYNDDCYNDAIVLYEEKKKQRKLLNSISVI